MPSAVIPGSVLDGAPPASLQPPLAGVAEVDDAITPLRALRGSGHDLAHVASADTDVEHPRSPGRARWGRLG
jgi:hypothetical protein